MIYTTNHKTSLKYSNDLSNVDPVFSSIVGHISSRWPDLLELNQDACLIREIIQKYRLRASEFINYDKQALAFTKAYFFKNLYKALVALASSSDYLRHDLPIVDVGAGAGVFTIAWCTLLGSSKMPITLLDPSGSQLDIARRILGILGIEHTKFKQELFVPSTWPLSSMRLFSYWFCEHSDCIPTSRDIAIRDLLGTNGLVIDYPEVVTAIAGAIRNDYNIKVLSTLATPPPSFSDLFNDPDFIVNTVCYYNVR